jgi:hypothetical protein
VTAAPRKFAETTAPPVQPGSGRRGVTRFLGGPLGSHGLPAYLPRGKT